MTGLSFRLVRDEHQDALEDALDLVERDVQEGIVDADHWGGDISDAEKLRILADAYTGRLEVGNGEESGA